LRDKILAIERIKSLSQCVKASHRKRIILILQLMMHLSFSFLLKLSISCSSTIFESFNLF